MFNISYEATLVAGQIGFSLHEESTPVVEPFAGWAMLTTQDTHLAVRNHIQASQCNMSTRDTALNSSKKLIRAKDITHHSSIAFIVNYATIPDVNYGSNEDSQQHITWFPYFSICKT